MNNYFLGVHPQLIARCLFDKQTGKVKLEDYQNYYPPIKKEGLFKH